MFGRQIFFEPVDSGHIQRRRDALRHILVNQRHGLPCTELASIPSLRNDSLMLALNLILIEDDERIQPNNIYLRTSRANTPNEHMLNYIRQMEERYLAMERELTRAKMLIPRVTRTNNSVHHTVKPNENWKEHVLAKYRYLFENSTGTQSRRNRPQMNVSSRRKRTEKRAKVFSQNLQNDTYPMKESSDYACQSRMVNGDSTAFCPLHNVSVVVPQDAKQSPDLSEQNQANFKGNNIDEDSVNKYDTDKSIFHNLRKQYDATEARKLVNSVTNDDAKTPMDVCQRFGKEDEPEMSCDTGLNVKCKTRAHTKSDMSTPECQSTPEPEFANNIFDRKSEILPPTCHRPETNANFNKKCLPKQTKLFEEAHMRKNILQFSNDQSQCKRNYGNNNHAKNFGYERASRCSRDFNHSSRMIHKEKKDTYQRGPIPRSTVHTAYTPMPQCSSWNTALDPNVFSIQLLRLAVLLYAPALMPALNLLIARQTVQTSIPVPCSEGSNDLLSQIFTILNNQQNVPNLRYPQNSGTDESSQPQRELNWQNLRSSPQNVAKQLRNAKTSFCDKLASNEQLERNSIAVNTSLELCGCSNMKQSSTSTTYDQIEETEKLVNVWTDQKSELSKTMMLLQEDKSVITGKKVEDVIDADVDLWL